MRAALVGKVGGRAGRKLASIERRVREREDHATRLERERQHATAQAEQLDGRLVKLEGAELAGQDHTRELAEVRKALADAQAQADAIDDRTLAVAAQAANVARQEWRGYIAEHLPALQSALHDEAKERQTTLADLLTELLAQIDGAREFQQRCTRLAHASPHGNGQDVEVLPQPVEDLRRALRHVIGEGVPMARPTRLATADPTIRSAA
jgi:chromosome segregation ATPase